MFNPFKKQKISTERIGGFQVEVSRKRIKNLYLKVSPLSQKVRVSVPMHVPDKAIEHFVVSRADWIKKQLAKKLVVPKVEVLNFVTGEIHFYKGKSYQLEVVTHSGSPKVELLENDTIVLRAKSGTSEERKEKVMNEWYRASLKEEIPKLIEKWEPVMHVQVKEFGVKRMKTRWGTCNIGAQRIWLSLELAKKSPECLEYVVVHEMVHLLERLHNKRFHAFMDLFLPDWRERKKELNGRIC